MKKRTFLFAVVLLVVGMVGVPSFQSAKAVTVDELQAQIRVLLAQINSLKAQLPNFKASQQNGVMF